MRAQIVADTGRGIKGHYEHGERVPEDTILSLVLPRVRRGHEAASGGLREGG